MEPITFSFTPQRTDYIRTLRAFLFTSRAIYSILIVSFLFFASSIYFSVQYGLSSWTVVLLVLSLIIATSYLFTSPITAGDKAAREERMSCETQWEANDEYILVKNKFSQTNFDWGTFSRVFETKEHFLLICTTNKNMFQFVPKRAFISADQEQGFRKLLEAKNLPIKPLRVIKLPEPSRRVWMLIVYGLIALLIFAFVVYSYMGALNR